MNPKLDKQLCEKYPEIFADRYSDPKTTAMCWGLDVGDGWFALIDNLCNDIQTYVNENHLPPVVATQVKEKFGGLRFYIGSGHPHIWDLINKAEKKSYNICEICGKDGKVNDAVYWLQTLCEKHREVKCI